MISTWDSAADFLYGDHWFGPTFLSLVDPSKARLINTISIRPNEESPDDDGSFAVPYFTNAGFYYVPHSDKKRMGKPLLLHLQDLTGEGIAGQFVLLDHVVSGIAAGSVLGYSVKSDKAVQYPVQVTQNKFNPVVENWAIQVFDRKPSPAGYWKFTWEAGHGESDWIDEEVRFDPARPLFVQKMTIRPYPGYAQFHCDLDTASLTDFLQHLKAVASNGTDTQWLQDLVRKTPANNIGSAGMVPIFHGTQQDFTLEFQSSAAGVIGIDIATESDFAAALQPELKSWCATN